MPSSGKSRHKSQVSFVIIFLRQRFFFVGRDSEDALQRKCLTLFGILSLQMLVQSSLLAEELDGPRWLLLAVLAKRGYADFVEYIPFFVSYQILTSKDCRELKGILRISLASKGRNSSLTRTSS